MVRIYIISIVSVFAFFWAGCAPIELARVDQGAELAIQAAEQSGRVLSSPIGLLIPPPITAGLKLAMAGLVAAAMGWQEFRRRTATQAVGEIVRGIELLADGTASAAKDKQRLVQSKATSQLVRKAKFV